MKLRKRGIVLLAACFALGAPVQSAAQVTYYNYGGSSDKTSTSRYGDEDQDVLNGPGVVSQVTEEEEISASVPGVKEVTLTEQYHEEYGTYEESMAGQFFIYSNVGNGGFSDSPVYVDIPANLTWTMEKDGIAMEYASGQMVGEKGTYVLKLSGVVNPELPLSRQTEYKAVFRFRIQEKLPVQETEPEETAYGSGAAGMNPEETEISDFYNGGTSIWQEQMEETQAIQESAPAGEISQSDSDPENETETAGNGEEAVQPETEEGQTAGQLTQSYNPATGRYDIFTAGGARFSSTVPEGIRACRDAVLYLEDGVLFSLYKDGEALEYVSGNVLKDRGDYWLETGGSVFHFSIGAYVTGENLYTAPLGMTISQAVYNGEIMPAEYGRYVWMENDGIYEFLLAGETGETFEIALTKDSIPPEAELDISKGRATILQMSEDTETAVLAKDGGDPQELKGTEISSPGKYRLTLTDYAGNENTYEFSLVYQMNFYAVFAVILVIVLIAGAVIFIRYTKRNMKIR